MANLIPSKVSFTLIPADGAMDSFVDETPPEVTTLSTACDALAAGDYVYFATPGLFFTAAMTSPLYGLQWVNRFFYNNTTLRAYQWGKNASTQGTWRTNNLYDEVQNNWTSLAFQNPEGELGHVYESFAGDLIHEEFYSCDGIDNSIVKMWKYGDAQDYFLRPAADYVTKIDSTQGSICWHPNLYGTNDPGLIAASGAVDNAPRLVAWQRSSGNPGTWGTISGTVEAGSTGSYQAHGSMTYVRSLDAVIYVSRATLRTYKIPAGSSGSLGTVVELGACPITCTWTDDGGTQGPNHPPVVGVLVDDPAGTGGPYILEKNKVGSTGTNRVWRLVGSTWTLVGTHPFPRGGVDSGNDASKWAIAPLYPYGVFWCISRAATGSQSYLWKPDV